MCHVLKQFREGEGNPQLGINIVVFSSVVKVGLTDKMPFE